jgi:CTP synthase
VTIGVVGKYTDLKDAYKSINESFIHAGAENDVRVELKWLRAEDLDDRTVAEQLAEVSGVLIPGGFGERGVEGKIKAVQYVREHNIPFFGICLGLQCAVIEFARNVCGMKGANSTEFRKTKYNVIDLMLDQRVVKNMGGTMRLGAYPCILQKKTKAHSAYRKELISERHRHRYEVNNKFRKKLSEHGMVFSGISPDGSLVEIIELPQHRWFVAGQFHPELKSRVLNPHPLFRDFVRAAFEYQEEQKKK